MIWSLSSLIIVNTFLQLSMYAVSVVSQHWHRAPASSCVLQQHHRAPFRQHLKSVVYVVTSALLTKPTTALHTSSEW